MTHCTTPHTVHFQKSLHSNFNKWNQKYNWRILKRRDVSKTSFWRLRINSVWQRQKFILFYSIVTETSTSGSSIKHFSFFFFFFVICRKKVLKYLFLSAPHWESCTFTPYHMPCSYERSDKKVHHLEYGYRNNYANMLDKINFVVQLSWITQKRKHHGTLWKYDAWLKTISENGW